MKTALTLTATAATAYIATYFAVVSLPANFRFRPPQMITDGGTTFLESSNSIVINGERLPDFHGAPFALFRPVYHLDRQVLRRSYWQPYPRGTELSFDWLVPEAPSTPGK